MRFLPPILLSLLLFITFSPVSFAQKMVSKSVWLVFVYGKTKIKTEGIAEMWVEGGEYSLRNIRYPQDGPTLNVPILKLPSIFVSSNSLRRSTSIIADMIFTHFFKEDQVPTLVIPISKITDGDLLSRNSSLAPENISIQYRDGSFKVGNLVNRIQRDLPIRMRWSVTALFSDLKAYLSAGIATQIDSDFCSVIFGKSFT